MKAVSKTAYYCCGVRMTDAESDKPLVGDNYARILMGEDGLAYWKQFEQYKRAIAGNTVRCYLIDEYLRKRLNANPDLTVFIIGAGLDSRAFRLKGGNWIEIDEVAIINYKNGKLLIEQCQNKLQRITIDFEKETMKEKLAPFSDLQNVVVIIEGVLLYLTHEQKTTLINDQTIF